jgi:hypothetical protein
MKRDEDLEINKFLQCVGSAPGVHVQRVHVLKVRLPSGSYLNSTLPGTPDVYCCANGRHLWLEFKKPGGGRSETSQKVWHTALSAAGGEVWVVRDGVAAACEIADISPKETSRAIITQVEAIRG